MLTGLKFFTSMLSSEFAVNFRWKCHNTSNVIYDLLLIAIPVSNYHLFSDINISQSSVATHLRCGVIFSCHFSANLSLSLTVKEFWKSVKIWQSYRHEFGGPIFLEHIVYTDIPPVVTPLVLAGRTSMLSHCLEWHKWVLYHDRRPL